MLDKSKIIEQGTHRELMDLKGMYYELFTSQALDEQTHSILK